ncbi:hypothetical protein MKJ04_07005 [Pontibacter sp. E15-1]|uniref:hypothetical protein n=1 Tax=Pontibacter sp. E15-1 TaxID=2919918 RepID=UPI001F4F9065|nr:hypothetical protein [Pontibacter sp. E15-1]MCJ8164591.1 hypothetical protein [Pontibacter sp. E15-1]
MYLELRNAFGKVFLQIGYNPVSDYVYCNWLSYQTKESVMHGATVMLDLLQQHGCRKVLNNNTQVVGPWDHSIGWLYQVWLPKALALGLNQFANVSVQDSFSDESFTKISDLANLNLFVNTFTDEEVAKEWLKISPLTLSALHAVGEAVPA